MPSGWMLVDDFITNFNKYQQRMFVPGSHLEAKKTIIQWYGIGGSYIDYGLLMYITRDKIQTMALRSKIVPTLHP